MNELWILMLLWGIPIGHLVVSKFNAAMEADDEPRRQSLPSDEGHYVDYPDAFLPAPGEFIPIRSRPGPMWAP
jgi:hypothetical protein